MKPLDEKRLDETIAKINKRCKVQKSKYIEPPTVKDVLLKKYRDSDEALASSRVIGRDVNGIIKFYRVGVEKGYNSLGQALDAEIAYLNSAAEVGK